MQLRILIIGTTLQIVLSLHITTFHADVGDACGCALYAELASSKEVGIIKLIVLALDGVSTRDRLEILEENNLVALGKRLAIDGVHLKDSIVENHILHRSELVVAIIIHMEIQAAAIDHQVGTNLRSTALGSTITKGKHRSLCHRNAARCAREENHFTAVYGYARSILATVQGPGSGTYLGYRACTDQLTIEYGIMVIGTNRPDTSTQFGISVWRSQRTQGLFHIVIPGIPVVDICQCYLGINYHVGKRHILHGFAPKRVASLQFQGSFKLREVGMHGTAVAATIENQSSLSGESTQDIAAEGT